MEMLGTVSQSERLRFEFVDFESCKTYTITQKQIIVQHQTGVIISGLDKELNQVIGLQVCDSQIVAAFTCTCIRLDCNFFTYELLFQ